MKQLKFPAVFMRGGTSNALMFHRRDLPADRGRWAEIFLAAMGSPDRYGRQLDGMGGGISSLSKVCVVGPSSHAGADVDYTFAQVQIKKAEVDFGSMCGNMSSAIGPFALDEGLIRSFGPEALVRIHNTNTGKIIHSRFPVDDGQAAVDGSLTLPGVSGTGALVRLEFLEPGGATTGKLLPTGNVVDTLEVEGVGRIRASLVDSGIGCCLLLAEDLGLKGTEMPEKLDGETDLLDRLARIRIAASLAMKIAPTAAEAAKFAAPVIGFVSPPQTSLLISGETLEASSIHFTARMLSNGQPHRALPLTASLCLAAAARLEGSLVHQVAGLDPKEDSEIMIGSPSGLLATTATMKKVGTAWHVEKGGFCRTQRRLFDGNVYVRSSLVAPVKLA
jgi:2-methylaconitate cis-trans-isomerase PrpF